MAALVPSVIGLGALSQMDGWAIFHPREITR
jgi:hypothetical protein